MSNFDSLNLKALVCTAIATIPTLLLLNGFDAATNLAVAQARAQTEVTAPVQIAQAVDIPSQAVLVD